MDAFRGNPRASRESRPSLEKMCVSMYVIVKAVNSALYVFEPIMTVAVERSGRGRGEEGGWRRGEREERGKGDGKGRREQ